MVPLIPLRVRQIGPPGRRRRRNAGNHSLLRGAVVQAVPEQCIHSDTNNCHHRQHRNGANDGAVHGATSSIALVVGGLRWVRRRSWLGVAAATDAQISGLLGVRIRLGLVGYPRKGWLVRSNGDPIGEVFLANLCFELLHSCPKQLTVLTLVLIRTGASRMTVTVGCYKRYDGNDSITMVRPTRSNTSVKHGEISRQRPRFNYKRYLHFGLAHKGLALSVVDTKGKCVVGRSWQAVERTDSRRLLFTESTSELEQRCRTRLTITSVRVAVVDARRTVEASMLALATNLDLVLAVQSDVAIGTDTVLKVGIVRRGEMAQLWSKTLEEGRVLDSLSALSSVFTRQAARLVAVRFVCCVMELTDGCRMLRIGVFEKKKWKWKK